MSDKSVRRRGPSVCCSAPVIAYHERRVGHTRSCFVCCECGEECFGFGYWPPVERHVVHDAAVPTSREQAP